MFASSRKALPLLSWFLFIFIAFHHVCQKAHAMKESTTISLSSQTQKHDMFDTFGFDSKSSSMTFQKLKMKILGVRRLRDARAASKSLPEFVSFE